MTAAPDILATLDPRQEVDRLLELITSLQNSEDSGQLARRLVAGAAALLGFRQVILRLRDLRSNSFELRASVGIGEGHVSQMRDREINDVDLAELTREENREGRCYILPSAAIPWSPRHCVLVPLLGPEASLVGYLLMENPLGGERPVESTLRMAERLADQAAAALDQVRLRTRLSQRERELSVQRGRVAELESLKGNFVSAISHELRTPLTSVLAYADGMLSDFESMDPATAREFLEIITSEGRRLGERIDGIIELSSLEDSEGLDTRTRFDLVALVRDATEVTRSMMEDKDIQLVLDVSVDSLELHGDRSAIEQLLRELVHNAIKFAPPASELRVRASESDSEVELSVQNSGEGIPEEDSGRIFERFYQVDGSTTRAHGGQGVGLALCRRIVESHDGRIWVETPVEGGARFEVRLPRKRAVVRGPRANVDSLVRRELLEFLDQAAVLVSELMRTEIASIMVSEPGGDTLRIEAAVGLEEEIVRRTEVVRGQGVAGRVWSEANTIMVDDIRKDDRFNSRVNDQQYSNYSLLSCPLRFHGQVVGVLNVNNKRGGGVFDDDDRLLLEALAARVSIAYERFESFQRNHRQLQRARGALRAALEVTRDRRTPIRDLAIACGLEAARKMGMSEGELRPLAYALRVYDLGLTRVGQEVLKKVAPLTTQDRDRVQDHVDHGVELGAALEDSPRMQQILYHHHENVDGSGYPDGLRGEDIPLGSRVIRLVDAFAAMLHGRPGRSPLEVTEAVALVNEGIGRRFCPRLAPLFLETVNERLPDLEDQWERYHRSVVEGDEEER